MRRTASGTTIRYGRRRAQVGDLRLPATPGPHPVVIVLHGGFWQAVYGRRLMDRLSADLADHGFAAWNLEYRRVGVGGGWPATFLDVAAGVDAVARLPGVDAGRVTTLGHSAGGQLALWAASRPGLPGGAPGASPAVAVRAAVALAGVVDLVDAATRGVGGPAVRQLLGGRPTNEPDRYALASPAARLPIGVPQLVVHGEADRHVPVDMSRSYAEAASAAGDEVHLCTPAGVAHMDLLDPRSPAWTATLGWLEDRR
ncbi:MAG: prolyl oligopeptidase family serine peptidase [Actinomycetota bacterium]|nr:prolyl oligopeptidase family serine peptidase [Actinomycetota bacterium]